MRPRLLRRHRRAIQRGFLFLLFLGVLVGLAGSGWGQEEVILNPHSDLIFRATGARSCGDCHRIGRDGRLQAQVVENDLVTELRGRAKGVHGPGRFADCLRCHAGGDKGVEKYRAK